MTTPIFLTGWEHGTKPTTNGGGMTSAVGTDTTSPTVETNVKNSGTYSLKLVALGAGLSTYFRETMPASTQIALARVYCYIPTGGLPSATVTMIGFNTATLGSVQGLDLLVTGALRGNLSGGSSVTSSVLSLDAWHLVEIRVNITATTWVMDWQIDGVTQTQVTSGTQSSTDSLSWFRIGSSSTSISSSYYVDDLIISVTSADYPIGAGATTILKPSADGTHNIAANTLEDNAGNDINGTTVPAFSLINSIPISTTSYIQQNTLSTTSYAEVVFDDVVPSTSSIIGAMALLAYTSATTSTNNGATMVSKDGFATKTDVWGNNTTPLDMSDGALTNLYFKSIIIAGVTTLATANSITGRLGYSGDATPDPYWVDLLVEVAYTISTVTNTSGLLSMIY